MTLTEILLLIIALGGAFYLGFVFGQRSVLEGGAEREASPLPGPDDLPPMPADMGGELPRRSPPPPASAGGAAPPGGQREVRRTAKPPPARAGLMGTGGSDGKKN